MRYERSLMFYCRKSWGSVFTVKLHSGLVTTGLKGFAESSMNASISSTVRGTQVRSSIPSAVTAMSSSMRTCTQYWIDFLNVSRTSHWKFSIPIPSTKQRTSSVKWVQNVGTLILRESNPTNSADRLTPPKPRKRASTWLLMKQLCAALARAWSSKWLMK